MKPAISATGFLLHLSQCFQNSIPDRILLALSGGADSMCLAYLLAQYKRRSHPLMLISAVTIDHGFRQESGIEAKKVGAIVLQWGIQHHVEKLCYPRSVHSITNFEEVARDLRYEVFRDVCSKNGINALLVAHNKDDRLETFIQRLQMNSTMFGLLGLRERSPLPNTALSPDESKKMRIYRPLLQYEKTEIIQTCKTLGVPWFEDVSNQDILLTKRNLIRHVINEVVPQALSARPELQCITRKSLGTTFREVERIVNGFELEKTHLDQRVKSLTFQFDEINAGITFALPLAELIDIPQPVMARWLYQTIHPLSSSKNFHWSYAKLERQAMPRIWTWLRRPRTKLTMTYLNVSFNLHLEGEKVVFDLSRQIPQRETLQNSSLLIPSGDCVWHLFDHLWWIKFENLDRDVRIQYCTASSNRALRESFPELPRMCGMNRPPVPFVVDEVEGQILAVPTLGLSKEGLSVSCRLKE